MLDINKSLEILLGVQEKQPTPLEILMKSHDTRPAKSAKDVDVEDTTETVDVSMPGFAYEGYMSKSKGIKREDMPQISQENLDDFLIHFSNKAKVKKIKRKLLDLKPTQGEINEDKILSRIKEKSDSFKTRKYICSLDGYILDGHHDWAYGLEVDPDAEVDVYRVNIPIDKLVSRTKKMKISKQFDIDGKEIQKALEVIEYVLQNPNEYSEEIVEKAKRMQLVTVHGKTKTFQRKQLVGTDKQEEQKEQRQRAPENTKEKKSHWYSEINEKYKLNKLPVGIPKENVIVDLTGDVNSKAVMKWRDPKTGREQRAYTQVFMEKNAQAKYQRISQLDFDVDSKIITAASKNLKDINSLKDQSYAILAIIAHTGLRPGSRRLYQDTKNRGISTLGPDNVIVKGNNVVLNFIGKSYHENNASFKDAKLAKFLQDLKAKNKGKEFLFDVSTTKGADAILKNDIGLKNTKIKDLRTFQAAKIATEFLHSTEMMPPPLPKTGVQKAIQQKMKTAFEVVSKKLNNSPAMAKKSYVPPAILVDWITSLGLDSTALIKGIEDDLNRPQEAWVRLQEKFADVEVEDTLEEPTDEYGEELEVEFEIPLALRRILAI